MATVTKRRSWISRLLRALTRRKEPVVVRRRGRGWEGPDDGSAGVREPRRPNPAPPAMAASADEAS
jgi:hypothetical protein